MGLHSTVHDVANLQQVASSTRSLPEPLAAWVEKTLNFVYFSEATPFFHRYHADHRHEILPWLGNQMTFPSFPNTQPVLDRRKKVVVQGKASSEINRLSDDWLSQELWRVLKGRGQHSIRKEFPPAFRRDYYLESVRAAKQETILGCVES